MIKNPLQSLKIATALLLIVFSRGLFAQNLDVSFRLTFNSIQYDSQPWEKSDLTQDDKISKRKERKIKSIIKKVQIDDPGLDPLVYCNPMLMRDFVENHCSHTTHYFYNTDGVLIGETTAPMGGWASAKDSVEYMNLKVKEDSSKQLTEVNYYERGKLRKSQKYSKGLLIEIMLFDATCTINQIDYVCNEYMRFQYDEFKRIKSRSYNYTYNCWGLARVNYCEIEESEIYEYKKNETIITKQNLESGVALVQINKIKYNKKGLLETSKFYPNGDEELCDMYTCIYDEHNNIIKFYWAEVSGNQFENKPFVFENTYDEKGNLISVVDTDLNLRYTYNELGLLSKIESSVGKSTPKIQYEYVFY